jgi:hypothetical protein
MLEHNLQVGLIMETVFLSTGLACLIAAVIGGGLKAFGIELPIVQSVKRQVILGLLGCVLIFAAIEQHQSAVLERVDVPTSTHDDHANVPVAQPKPSEDSTPKKVVPNPAIIRAPSDAWKDPPPPVRMKNGMTINIPFWIERGAGLTWRETDSPTMMSLTEATNYCNQFAIAKWVWRVPYTTELEGLMNEPEGAKHQRPSSPRLWALVPGSSPSAPEGRQVVLNDKVPPGEDAGVLCVETSTYEPP